MDEPKLTRWVSAAVSPEDKELLRRIAYLWGSAGESATLRRLIREEARRQQLAPDVAPAIPRPAPEA